MNDQDTPQFEVVQQVNAIESISRAEVDMQISTAKKYPRSLQKVRSNMMSFATLDEETAQSCFYAVPRGGKTIQGPSVRLAEIAVSCYGNLRAGSRIIESCFDGPMPHVTVQGVCHDLENNVAFTVEKRRRIVKKKSKDAIDEDDVNLAVNACAAIAFRDAVYKVVPMALIKPVYEQCIKVAIGSADTLVARRTRALEGLAKMGVTGPQVLTRLGRASIEDVTVDDLAVLYGLRNAIKDNQTTVDEEFPQVQSATSKPNLNVNPAPQQTSAGPASSPTPVTTAPVNPAVPTPPTPGEPKKPRAPRREQAVQQTPPPAPEPAPNEQSQEADAGLAPVESKPAAAPEAQAPTGISAAHQQVRDILFEQGVKVSRFLDFMEGSARFENATTIGFEGIPEEVVRRLVSDPAAFAKCLKYCKS